MPVVIAFTGRNSRENFHAFVDIVHPVDMKLFLFDDFDNTGPPH